jgi:hypothetical protein
VQQLTCCNSRHAKEVSRVCQRVCSHGCCYRAWHFVCRPDGAAALQACVLLYVLLCLGAPPLAAKPQSKQTQQLVLVKRIAMCRALATMCTSSLSTAVLSSVLGTAATKRCTMIFTAIDAFMHTVIVLLSRMPACLPVSSNTRWALLHANAEPGAIGFLLST